MTSDLQGLSVSKTGWCTVTAHNVCRAKTVRMAGLMASPTRSQWITQDLDFSLWMVTALCKAGHSENSRLTLE